MPQDLTVNASLVIPLRALQWRLSCASGPTGKGINTMDSPVELVASVFVYVGGLISTVVNLLLLEIAFISCFLMRLRLFTVAA